jgi:hypothetical protein
MNLYAKNGDFAFMGENAVVAATNDPSAGTWYIGVKCNKNVQTTAYAAYYGVTGRYELCNGIAYMITATVTP